MNLLFHVSSVAMHVSEPVLNVQAGEEERAEGGTNGGDFNFSLCPSLFAPLSFPALAEALHEGSQAPVRNMSKRGEGENGPSSDHNP